MLTEVALPVGGGFCIEKPYHGVEDGVVALLPAMTSRQGSIAHQGLALPSGI